MRLVPFCVLLAACPHPTTVTAERCPDDAVRAVESAGWHVMEVVPIEVIADGHPDRAALLVPKDAIEGDTDDADGIGIGAFETWPAPALGVLVCEGSGWALADEPTPLDEGYSYGFDASDAIEGPAGPLASVTLWQHSFESYAQALLLGTATDAMPVWEPATRVGVVGSVWGVGQDVALMDDTSRPLAASGWFPYGADRLWAHVELYYYEGESWNLRPRAVVSRDGLVPYDDAPLEAWFVAGTGPVPEACGRPGTRCRTFDADPPSWRPGVDWIAGAWADPADAPPELIGPASRWLWTGDREDGLVRGPDGLVPLGRLPAPRAASQAPPPDAAPLPSPSRSGDEPLRLVAANTGAVSVHAVSSDRRWAATLGYDGRIDVYSAVDAVRVRTIAPELFRDAVLFGPDGLLVVASMNRIEVWDVIAGARVADVAVEGTPAVAIAGERLLVGDRAGLWWHDLRTAERAGGIVAFEEAPDDVAVGPDGRAAAAWRDAVRVWDADGNERLVAAPPDGSEWASVLAWFDGDDLLVARSGAIRRWTRRGAVDEPTDERPRDLDGRVLLPLSATAGTTPDAIAFADASRLVAAGGGQVEVWDLDRLTHARIAVPSSVVDVAADADGATVLWTAGDGSILGVELVPGPILRLGHDVDEPSEHGWSESLGGLLRGARLSPDRRLVAVWQSIWGDDPGIYPAATLLDAETGAEVGRLATEVTVPDPATGNPVIRGVDDAAFSDDGAILYTLNVDETVSAWDTATLAELWNRPRAQDVPDRFARGARSPDGLLRVRRDEAGLRVERDGAPGVTLAADVAGRWAAWTDDGWFDGGPEADRLLFGVRGSDVLALDQIALERNRPDRVLEALGRGDPRLTQHLAARAAARALRAGASTDGDAPTLVVDGIAAAEGGARVSFTASASAGLAGLQVYVDGVAVYDGRGRPLPGGKGEEIVPLLAGDNLVEISAFDAAGRESVRVRVDLAGPPEPRGDLWYLGIGVSDYADDRLDLRYAHKDAEDLAKLLAEAGGFDEVHVRTLTNEAATREGLAAARSFLAEARPEDTLVLFIAGHGMHDDDPAKTYYFLTHEADPERLSETAASFEQVEALLSGVAPRRKLWLMDTCESGEADVGPVEPVSTPTDLLAARNARGVRVKTAATAGPVLRVHERDRYLYRDVQRRTGAVVISSSRGGESSYESDAVRNGQFTEALLAALTSAAADADGDGWLTPAELRGWVVDLVAEATDGRQNPTIDRDNPLQTVALPLVPVTPPE